MNDILKKQKLDTILDSLFLNHHSSYKKCFIKYCPRWISNRIGVKSCRKTEIATKTTYIPWNTFSWYVSYSLTWLQNLFQLLHNRDVEQSDCTTQYEVLRVLVPLQQSGWSWTFLKKTKYHRQVSRTGCQYQHTVVNPRFWVLTVRGRSLKKKNSFIELHKTEVTAVYTF